MSSTDTRTPPSEERPQTGATGSEHIVEAEIVTWLLLRVSNLRPADTDMANLTAALPVARSGVRTLYAIDEARYEQPALLFRASIERDGDEDGT
jgi:hypothetical protein